MIIRRLNRNLQADKHFWRGKKALRGSTVGEIDLVFISYLRLWRKSPFLRSDYYLVFRIDSEVHNVQFCRAQTVWKFFWVCLLGYSSQINFTRRLWNFKTVFMLPSTPESVSLLLTEHFIHTHSFSLISVNSQTSYQLKWCIAYRLHTSKWNPTLSTP